MLALADGSRQVIAAGDPAAAPVVAAFAVASRLSPTERGDDGVQRIVVLSVGNATHRCDEDITLCLLDPLPTDEYRRCIHLRQVGQSAAQASQARGGLLVHGALAELAG